MEAWRNREWAPTEEERGYVAALRNSDVGQVMLRLLDEQIDSIAQECLYPGLAEAELSMQEWRRFIGNNEALQLVKSWLLAERDSEPESQETDDG